MGVLAKAVAPGEREQIPLWLTVLCGVGGVVAGTYAYGLFFNPETAGFDWWRHIWQVVMAVGLVMLAARVTGRSRT